eukprot:2410229-Lingulodinium_polyedra.AAC.1
MGGKANAPRTRIAATTRHGHKTSATSSPLTRPQNGLGSGEGTRAKCGLRGANKTAIQDHVKRHAPRVPPQ